MVYLFTIKVFWKNNTAMQINFQCQKIVSLFIGNNNNVINI